MAWWPGRWPGLARAGEPGADPGFGGRRAGAEHRCLRAGAEGPLPFAGRGGPGHRAQRHAGRRACLRLPRQRLQADRLRRPGRQEPDHPGAPAPAAPWQPVLGYLDLERAWPRPATGLPDARTIFDWVCASAAPSCPIRPSSAMPAASSRTRWSRRTVPRHHRPRPEIVHYPMPDGSSSWPPAG
jgi:hypothetical protein